MDAGCGTGNYSKVMLDAGVGKINMFDGSEGMLKQARAKIQEYLETPRVVGIQQNFLPSLPFDDEHFNAVMFMQV